MVIFLDKKVNNFTLFFQKQARLFSPMETRIITIIFILVFLLRIFNDKYGIINI